MNALFIKVNHFFFLVDFIVEIFIDIIKSDGNEGGYKSIIVSYIYKKKKKWQ